MKVNTQVKCALLAATALGYAMPALAQDGPAAGADDAGKEDIVVTGTLIRGIAPVGSNVIGVGEQKIQESGASTGAELLAKVPQLGSFGTVPFGVSGVTGSNASNPINRPNLRNLPAAQTSGGSQTLVLIDGHRVVGAGTQQVAVDPDLIAPSAVQRVEALTDGGSAVYGSDALGGVINFITRKRFDGVEMNARVGFGKDVTSYDASVIAGKDWGSGGVYVTYNYSHHDELFGIDRDYARRINFTTGVPVGRNCAVPNITAGGTSYVVSGAGLAAGGPNTCDQSDDGTLYPRATLHNVFARLNQDLADWLSFDVTVLYANRDTRANGGTLGSDLYRGAQISQVTYVPVGVTPGAGQVANALYRPVPGDLTGVLPELVQFNLEPVLGRSSNTQRTRFDTWQVAPSFTFKLGGDWQLRTLFSYGRSKVSYENRVLVPGALSAGLANGGGLNPFNLALSTPAALASVVGFDRGYGRNELFDARAIADGPLAHLPGGDLRIAIGAEYLKDNFQRQSTAGTFLTPTAISNYSQTVKSVFGEATIPIFGEDNGFDGMRVLTASVSARYDSYNDFGSTFNPKVGLTWKPVDWWTFRGSWGKSFNAPSPVDQLGVFTAQATWPGTAAATIRQFPTGSNVLSTEAGILLINGAALNLKPQRANSWSIGTTIEPPFVPGLQLNLSYYTIKLDGTLGRPVGVDLTPFYANYPSLFYIHPTGAQLASFVSDIATANQTFVICNPTSSSLATVATTIGGCGAGTPVGAALDTRLRNLGATTLTGLDFSAFYKHETGFGSIDASFAGNLRFKQDSRAVPTAAVSHDLDINTPKLRFQASVGADVGNFRGQVTWNHSAGYNLAAGTVAASFGQLHTDAFNTFDLFLKYDVKGSGIGKDLSFTLNIQNLLDQDPPLVKGNDSTQLGFDQQTSFTLGRFFQLGVRKKF